MSLWEKSSCSAQLTMWADGSGINRYRNDKKCSMLCLPLLLFHKSNSPFFSLQALYSCGHLNQRIWDKLRPSTFISAKFSSSFLSHLSLPLLPFQSPPYPGLSPLQSAKVYESSHPLVTSCTFRTEIKKKSPRCKLDIVRVPFVSPAGTEQRYVDFSWPACVGCIMEQMAPDVCSSLLRQLKCSLEQSVPPKQFKEHEISF